MRVSRFVVATAVVACFGPLLGAQVTSTLTGATCSTGVTGILSSSGSVDIYDGSTIVATVASSGLTNAFSWAIPSNMNDSNFHVISAALHGTNTELIGSPQSFSCNGTAASSYVYQYDRLLSAGLDSNWTQNGTWTQAGNLLNASSAASAIFKTTVAAQNSSQLNDGTQYEINTSLTLSPATGPGGTYFHYIWANSSAMATSTGSQGTFHAIGITPSFDEDGNCAASLASYDVNNGNATLLGTFTVPCAVTMQMRTVVFKLPASNVTKIWTFVDGELYSVGTTLSPGQPGFGAVGAPYGSGFSEVKIGARSVIAPPSLGPVNSSTNPTTVSTATFPNQVDFQWQQPFDKSGVGVIQHWFDRMTTTAVDESTGSGFLGSTWADSVGVSPSQNYDYMELERGFHGINSGVTNIYVLTPPPNDIDPRRVGSRATGSYWGAMGEQIDNLSGNLHYSLPLLTAKGRNGNSVPLALSYNSQNWREDTGTGPGSGVAIWNLGEDIGYGYGWKVQFGSLTPYWNTGYYGVDHYVFIDGSGAEYTLNINNGGVWTSSESIFVYYNAAANVLYFKDGTQWYMNDTSGGIEPDYGTMYPTEIRDANGNQIIVTYQTGYGAAWPNSSGRISAIDDPRAVSNSNCTRCTYYFTYMQETGDPIKMHLSAIANTIGTNETYNVSFNNSAMPTAALTLKDPFAANSYGSLYDLTGITLPNSSLTYSFNYDGATGNAVAGAAQLSSVTFPFAGTLGWSYSSTQYTGLSPRYQEEVTTRTMNPGSGSQSYSFARTFGSGPTPVHNQTTLTDPHGDSEVWAFFTAQTAGPSSEGLVSSVQRNSAGGGTPSSSTLTWSADGASNAYLSASQSCTYSTCANAQTTVDNYGNPTQVKDWDYGASTSNAATRTYAYTYLHSSGSNASNYAGNYILNRLLSETVTDANATYTLVTNTYDGSNNGTAPTQISSPYPLEWNNAYLTAGSTATKYRGNLTQAVSKGVTNTYTVNSVGKATSASNSVITTNASYSTATNYAAPDSVNVNGNSNLQTSIGYSGFLAPSSVTDVGNSLTWSYTYDSAGRPATATAPPAGASNKSAVKTYSYATSAPFTTIVKVTASDNAQNRYNKTTFDGFGRAIQAVSYDSTGTEQSEVDTVYSPAACSPLGMATQVSSAFLPPASAPYTTTAFDGSGNILSKTLADASKTVYAYTGNSVTITDPAANWKTLTKDMFGNTITVVEPDPANPSTSTYTTTYTYNAVNSLLTVNLGTRNGLTQWPRSFTYDSTTRLTSKYEPESGTTSFTYNADGSIHTKTFGTGNVVTYAYDANGRMTSDGVGTIGYDSYGSLANLYSSMGGNVQSSNYLWGRVAYKQEPCASFGSGASCTEFFSYSPLGKVTQEVYAVAYGASYYPPAITATFSYDNEGRLTNVGYPDGTGYGYTFDTMGRPNAGSGSGGSTGPAASGALYNAAGQVTQLVQGGQVEDRTYNSLNQLTSIRKGSQIYTNYNYNAGTNNGQMASMQDRANGTATAYTYDSLKRLTSTSTTKFPTVANASFESMTIPYWSGTAQISSNAEHGLYSVQLGQIQQNFSCSGSCGTPTTYTVSGYMLGSSSSSALQVTVVGNTSAGAYQYAPAGQIFYASASTWAPFSYSFTTPSNLTGGLFVTLTSVITGPIYLDNITVAVQNGPNLISNGDFELGATPNGWWGGASYCGSAVHSGECAVVIGGTAPANAISQTVTGLSPSTSYNIGVWYNLEAGYALNLSAGGTPVQSTTSGSWQFLYGTWTSSSSGTLAISISVSTNGYAYLDDVTISGGPANPTVTQSEAFGFDGFGNLLSQTPTAGTGPMMSLTADHNSNRLLGQGNYDGAGNFLGNSQYSYDILNRLSATGTSSYTYSPGTNKRMAVYSSSGTSAQAAFHIYDPNGRKIGEYTYTATAPWSRAQFQPGLSKNIWYLGSKRVDMSEDQVGSNWDQTQYYPWGQVQAGQQPSETQGFGTYVLDGGSGLYYADQRYYNQNWGRFLTPDPSNANVDSGNPGSWNRYAYANGDPVNGNDPTGQNLWDLASGVGYESGEYADDDGDGGGGSVSFFQDWGDMGGTVWGDPGSGTLDDGTPVDVSVTSTALADVASAVGLQETGSPSSTVCNSLNPPAGPINYSSSAAANAQTSIWGWYQAFKQGGSQDFKGNSAFGSPANQVAVGNFNFGASVAAKGWSPSTAMGLAGAGALLSNINQQVGYALSQAGYMQGQYGGPSSPNPGTAAPPWTMGSGFPGMPSSTGNQGDQEDPNENQSVIAGYVWYSIGCH